MRETMHALQYMGPGDPRMVEAPIPAPGRGEVLVKILAVTTCPQWDFHIMDGEAMFAGSSLEYPYTLGQPGHEAMGEVVATGAGVDAPRAGDRVVCWRDPGHRRAGCYAQYNVLAAENVLAIPGAIRPESIAPLELAMCVVVSFQQLGRWTDIAGKVVAVGGLGPAGLVAVQLARAYGAESVIGIDPFEERHALALRMGASAAMTPNALEPPGADIPVPSRPFDLAVECAGAAASEQLLLDQTSEAVAAFGIPHGEARLGFRHFSGPAALPYRKHNREAAEKALELALGGQLDLGLLVGASMPLSDYARGVEMLRRREALKICFKPWE